MSRLRLDAYLPYRLSVASNKVSALIARAYEARFGLGIPQWRLLAVLSEAGGQTQSALVQRTAMDKVTVSRAAQTLVRRGLVQRAADPADRRAVRLDLSPAGLEIVRDVAPLALALEAELLAGLGPDGIERLDRALRALEAKAEALSAAGAPSTVDGAAAQSPRGP